MGKSSQESCKSQNGVESHLTLSRAVIGNIKEVLVVNVNDPVWETPTVEVTRIKQGSEEEIKQRQAELKP